MAKRTNEPTAPRPTSSLRVRWVEVELNGADSTIEEALHSLERLRRPNPEVYAIPKPMLPKAIPVNGDAMPLSEPVSPLDDEVGPASDTAMPELANGDPTDAGASRKKRGDGDRKDRNAGIKPVGDIDFVPAGKKSLKDLFAEKSPGSDMEQALVICYFLEHSAESNQIGPGHILSGFKHVNKPVPKDLKQTIRNMKAKKAWLKFTDIESVSLTTEGDNHVDHVLGKSVNGSGTS